MSSWLEGKKLARESRERPIKRCRRRNQRWTRRGGCDRQHSRMMVPCCRAEVRHEDMGIAGSDNQSRSTVYPADADSRGVELTSTPLYPLPSVCFDFDRVHTHEGKEQSNIQPSIEPSTLEMQLASVSNAASSPHRPRGHRAPAWPAMWRLVSAEKRHRMFPAGNYNDRVMHEPSV